MPTPDRIINHLPAVAGIPLAALFSIYLIYLANRYYNLRRKEFQPLPVFYMGLFWVLFFLAFLLAIRLLWPLTLHGEAEDDPSSDKAISINFLQINDVYEISPLDNGRSGGLARVATLLKQIKDTNANTYSVLSGDFVSPSALGTIQLQNKEQVQGQQMIDVLNSAKLDLATFGNHEFDISEQQLTDRMNQSTFGWVSSNVWHQKGVAYGQFMQAKGSSADPIPVTKVLTFTDKRGTAIRVGVLGITIGSTIRPWVFYGKYDSCINIALAQLRGRCDVIVALTHVDLADDIRIAQKFPEINLIMGGHEHKASYNQVGHTIIAKADANVRTVYLHNLVYSKKDHRLAISSRLLRIDSTLKEDADTRSVVDLWNNKGDSIWKSQRLSPCEVLCPLATPYDGTEDKIRYDTTNLTNVIANSMLASVKGAQLCLYNSGSIRIDDFIRDRVTQYDIIRTLPYGGKICLANIKGEMIKKMLAISDTSKGNGCYLQHDTAIRKGSDGKWKLQGKDIADGQKYRVAINDYLLDGRQERMEFLATINKSDIDRPDSTEPLRIDIRQAIIHYLKKGPTTLLPLKVPCY
ncbi:MAG TPA: bifunctional metallophosphatase/5'-nucleotidase [Puia sp.]|nr:bifunctional metallophosphatase/5'-nucleotidase [Puia sp.]